MRGVQLTRRALLSGAGGGLLPLTFAAGTRDVPGVVRQRISLPVGARTGDVTTDTATVWAAASGPGRLHVRLESHGRRLRSVRGAWADAATDFTARHTFRGLAPGREFDATLWFESPDGTRGQPQRLTFRTAPVHPAATSLLWSGDTFGQGYGIGPDGVPGYRAMLAQEPDLFLHCGDAVYADEPILDWAEERGRRVWRNRVELGVDHVAETLADFRGRHRYALLSEDVRAFHAAVPVMASWDDHETTNNWWPGGRVTPDDDPGYTEKRHDVLAARARRAWQEYTPLPLDHLNGKGRTGFAENLIHRKVPRGAHLDVFNLDMRSYRGGNDRHPQAPQPGLLGPVQEQWLIREVAASRATWKVIVADQPLAVRPRDLTGTDSYANQDDGAPLGREAELARVLSAFQAAGVRNVVWLTADVHYTAAHHFDPARAAYDAFDPFWEFISGPLHCRTFEAKPVDGTFGAERVFALGSDGLSDPPTAGKQFFGQLRIAADGALTVNLRDVAGSVLWSRVLEPER